MHSDPDELQAWIEQIAGAIDVPSLLVFGRRLSREARLHPRAPVPRGDRGVGRSRPPRPPRRGRPLRCPAARLHRPLRIPRELDLGILGKLAALRDEAATAPGPEDGRDRRRAPGIPGAGVRRSRRVRTWQHQRPDDLGTAARPGRRALPGHRLQPPLRLARPGTPVSMKEGLWSSAVGVGQGPRAVWWGAALISLLPPRWEDQAKWEAGCGGASPKRAVRRPDEKRRLPQRELVRRAGCG